MSGEWIRSRELLELVESGGQRTDNLERRLLVFLKAGSLNSRVEAVSLNLTRVEIVDGNIPSQIWSKASEHGFDLQSDRLSFNSGGYSSRPEFEAAGFAFERSRTLALLSIDPAQKKDGSAKADDTIDGGSKAGAKLDSEIWANFSAAFALLAKNGDFDSEDTINGLYVKVADLAMERSLTVPSKNTVSPAISLALRLSKGIGIDDQ